MCSVRRSCRWVRTRSPRRCWCPRQPRSSPGSRQIPIAFLGGLAIGVIENLVAGYVSPHVSFRGLSSAAPFILIFVGLLLLNKTRGRRAGTVSDEKLRDTDISRLPLWRRAGPWTVATIGLLIWITQANDVWLGYTIAGLCLALVFVSFTIVTGIGGMVSLSQATFVTAAALSSGYFSPTAGRSSLRCLPVRPSRVR